MTHLRVGGELLADLAGMILSFPPARAEGFLLAAPAL
jgi:hypothetical protein